MKFIVCIYFTLQIISLTAQEGDSTYILQFLDKEKFPAVDTVYYSKEYKRGKLVEEGWTVIETIGPDAKFFTDSSEYIGYEGTYLLGQWKYYSKNQQLFRVDTNSFENGHFISIEYHYWNNGNLQYYFYSRVNYNHPDRPKLKSGSIKDEDHFGDFITLMYTKKGVLKKKYVWKDNVLVLEETY
jgi:hypothetical protein